MNSAKKTIATGLILIFATGALGCDDSKEAGDKGSKAATKEPEKKAAAPKKAKPAGCVVSAGPSINAAGVALCKQAKKGGYSEIKAAADKCGTATSRFIKACKGAGVSLP